MEELFKHWDSLMLSGAGPVVLTCVLAFGLMCVSFWFMNRRKPEIGPITVPLTKLEKKELIKQRKTDPIYLALKLKLDRENAAEAIREGFKCLVFDGKMSQRRANFWIREIDKTTGLPIIQPLVRRIANKIGQPKTDFLKTQIKKRLNGGRVPAQLS